MGIQRTPPKDGPRASKRRLAPKLTALASAAVLLAGCGGRAGSAGSGESPTPGNASSPASAVAYSGCMRQHGVPRYPDPDQHGSLPKGDAEQFGVSPSQYDAAKRSCQQMLPTGGSLADQVRQCTLAGTCPPALVQRMMAGGRRLAQCLRDHGVARWPDPTLGGPNHTPMFPVSQAGLTRAQTHSSQVRVIAERCGQQPGAVMLPMG